jgi:hypothetical protein
LLPHAFSTSFTAEACVLTAAKQSENRNILLFICSFLLFIFNKGKGRIPALGHQYPLVGKKSC